MKRSRSRVRWLCRCARAAASVGLMALVGAPVAAQTTDAEPATRRSYSLVPNASLTQTFTDNGQLKDDATKRADSITQGTVGLRFVSGGGRLKGFFDYSLSAIVRARESERNELQNYLNASLTGEIIDNWVFVDTTASISQQSINAFATQTPDGAATSGNTTEVANFYVSPYVRGRLAGVAEYEARVNAATTQSRKTPTSDQSTLGASLSFNGGNRSQGAAWNALVSRQNIDYKQAKKLESDTLRGGLTYAASAQLLLGATAGREANNYNSEDKEAHWLGGVNLEWSPSVRTKLSTNYERRFFGNAHSVNLVHRTARTAWSFTDSRDISTNNGRPGLLSLGTAYDVFAARYASEPDPVVREQKIQQDLRNAGIVDPNTPAFRPFETSGVTLQRSTILSVGYVGLRETVTLLASRSETSRLSSLTSGGSSLDSTSAVRQRGVSLDWSHRLTPLSSTNLIFLLQKSNDAEGRNSTTLKSVTATWNTSLSPRSTVRAGARYVVFDASATSSYTERAVFASIRLQF